LIIRPCSSFQLWAAVDTDFRGDPHSTKSTGCAILYVGNNPIRWYSKLQPNVATSSCEAELMEHSRCLKEIAYFRTFLADIGFPQKPTPVLTDSLSAMALEESATVPTRSRHYINHLQYVRSLLDEGQVTIHKIPTEMNVADIGTKSLPRPRFIRLIDLFNSSTIDTTLGGHVTHSVSRFDTNKDG